MLVYRLSKIAHLYNRDLTDKEYGKSKKDTIVFDRNDCIEKTIVWLSGLVGEPSKVGEKLLSTIYS